MARGMAADVIGRDEELSSIAAFLARVEDGPSGLVFSGEPGSARRSCGKPASIRPRRGFGLFSRTEAQRRKRRCRSRGSRTCWRPSSRRRRPPLRRCGGGRSRSRSCWRSPVRRLQIRGPSGWPSSTSSRCSPTAAVVIALDDLQWLDPSSAGVLQIALRRLVTSVSACSATVRTAPETTVPVELDRASRRNGSRGSRSAR